MTERKSRSASAPTRRRRRSGELDELILAAARSLFASNGYAGTSSREIAKEAGVHEPAIYRRFGSKAGLFEAAVLEPFNAAISTYLASWEGQIDEPATLEELNRNFLQPLFELMREERALMIALLAAREFHAQDVGEGAAPALDGVLRRMDTQAQVEVLRRGLHTAADPGLTVRISTALVLGVALLEDWLFPAGPARPSDDELLDEMVRLVTYGVVERGMQVAKPVADDHVSPAVMRELLDRLSDAERRAVRAELELELERKTRGA